MSDWRESAACWGMDPRLFWPRTGTARHLQWEQVALDVCRRCTVVTECGSYADQTGVSGVWGGRYRPVRKNQYPDVGAA